VTSSWSCSIASLRRRRRGSPRFVVVRGEPGIGKTARCDVEPLPVADQAAAHLHARDRIRPVAGGDRVGRQTELAETYTRIPVHFMRSN
jgi:hypothetical protein